MKKKLTYILSLLLMLTSFAGCKTVVYDRQGGNEDIAYLQFISAEDYAGKKVEVVVDNSTTFVAKVKKERKSSIKPNLYTIKPGQRNVKVYQDGNLIVEQDIYVSQQKTKVIRL